MTAADTVLLDGGDLGCWRLLLRLRDLVRELPDGTAVHLVTTDPVAPIDLPAWCAITGHEYLGPVPSDDRPVYGVRVSGGAVPTDPDRPWHVSRSRD